MYHARSGRHLGRGNSAAVQLHRPPRLKVGWLGYKPMRPSSLMRETIPCSNARARGLARGVLLRRASLHSGSEQYTFQSSYIGSAYDDGSTPLAPPERRIIVLCAALPTATRDSTRFCDTVKRRHVLESHCEVTGPGESRELFHERRWRWDGVRVQGRPRKADGLASNAENSKYLSQ